MTTAGKNRVAALEEWAGFRSIPVRFRALILGISCLALLGWTTFAWRAAQTYADGRVAMLVHAKKEEASRQVDNAEGNVTHHLLNLQAVLRVLVQGETLVSHLRDGGRQNIRPVVRLLKTVQDANGADAVWVMGLDGRAIVTGEGLPRQGFYTTDFSKWDFFLQARQGAFAQQFYTDPNLGRRQIIVARGIVLEGKQFGVVAIKVDVSGLDFQRGQTDAFLTDRNGVVIAATDRHWEMRSVPGNVLEGLGETRKVGLYGRNRFDVLEFKPWGGRAIEPLYWIEGINEPVVVASQHVQATGGGYAYAMGRVGGLKGLEVQRYGLFALMTALGAAVVLVMDGLLVNSIKERQIGRLVREQKERLDEAQRLAKLGGWEADLSTHRLLASDEAIRILESDPLKPELTLNEFLSYVCPEDRRTLMKTVAKSIRHCIPYDLVYRLCYVDGRIKHVNARGQTYYDEQGEPKRMIGTLQDVSERVEAEEMKKEAEKKSRSEAKAQVRLQEATRANEELRELNEKLKQAQSQLLQSEKMASVGLLAAGVAHEINNPVGFVLSNLNSLEGYVRDVLPLLEKYERIEAFLPPDERSEVAEWRKRIDLDFLKEDVLSLLAESHSGIERVRKIVQNLKDFSRVDNSEAWKLEDLHAGLESTLSVVWNELKYHCEVRKEYGQLPLVECRLSELNQVFMNLLVNAAQAISQKGVITIRTGVQGEEVWVEIADTGSGMKPETVARIFEPFFTTKPVGKGTGLGLSVSYNIVQKHHGRFQVDSTPGVGTSFRIWLPMKQPHKDEAGEAAETVATG